MLRDFARPDRDPAWLHPPKHARRPSLSELGPRCQKLGHRELGSWMARRVGRPLALRVTWLVAPWGISAHLVTLLAWGIGTAAALAFCLGNAWSWGLGVVLWQLWYLLDHVDGQLARLHRTESLDGAQFDYWMHHAVHLCLPCGLGYGLFVNSCEPIWLMVGFVWGLAQLVVGLEPDTRAKTFILRLKRLSGELRVVGGGGGRPAPAARPPRSPLRLMKWLGRKSLESHVAMNLTTFVAVAQILCDDRTLITGRTLVACLAPLAVVVAVKLVRQSLLRESAEQEFAAWFRLPRGADMAYHDGWWIVHRSDVGEIEQAGKLAPATCQHSS